MYDSYIHTHTGADVILDFVGAPYWEKHSKCVAVDGRVIHLGFVSILYYLQPFYFLLAKLYMTDCIDM